MTNGQKAAALHCSVALACLDAIQRLEKPKTARWNRLDGAIDAVNRCVDLYRLQAFTTADLNNASQLIDTVNAEICRMYPDEDGK